MRHCGLDGLDAGGGGVFAGFGVVVEEVGGAAAGGRKRDVSRGLGRWVGLEGGGAYRVSSGRDMVADGALGGSDLERSLL